LILEKTVELVKQIYKYHKIMPPKVNKVIVGLGYTGVELLAYTFDPLLGLAQTLPQIIAKTNCSKIEFAGQLTKKKLIELLDWSFKTPSLEKIIGIATLNAMSQHILNVMNPYVNIESNLIDYLKINNNSIISCIGLIKPLVRELKEKTQKIAIVEENLSSQTPFKDLEVVANISHLKNDFLHPDILICTGTTLINNTIEDILTKFRQTAGIIILIGPTASMIPDILFDNGVDIVAGMKITDTEATIKVLQEGGGTKLFKKYGVKYNFIKKESEINPLD
jgi:uncharacterized protein (DUF4213/DUF364 family)